MKNKGLIVLGSVTAIAVAAAVFDFQWEKSKDERKSEEALVFGVKAENIHEFTMVFPEPVKVVKDGLPIVANKMAMAFQDGNWTLTSPIQEVADQENARTFVEQLASEKAMDVGVTKDKLNWAEFGLDSPKGSITVKDTNGKVTEIAVATRKNFEGATYLRRDQEERVLLGGTAWPQKLEKPFHEFRDKRPIRSGDSLTQVILKTPRGTFDFVSKDAKWQLTSHPKWKIDQERVRDLLARLTGNSISSFVAQGQLAAVDLKGFADKKQVVEIVAMLGEKKWTAKLMETQEVATSDQGRSKVYRLWIDEPSLLVNMTQFDAERFFKVSAEEFRDKNAPFQFRKADLKKIEIQGADRKIELEKGEKDWKLVSQSDPKLKVDEEYIPSLVQRLVELEAVEFQSQPSRPTTEKKVLMKDQSGQTLIELAFSQIHKRKVNGVDRSVVTAKSSLSEETLAIDEIKFKDLGLEEMLTPPKEEGAK